VEIAELQRLRDAARTRLDNAAEREQAASAQFQSNPEAYEEWQRVKEALNVAIADFNAANDVYLNAQH